MCWAPSDSVWENGTGKQYSEYPTLSTNRNLIKLWIFHCLLVNRTQSHLYHLIHKITWVITLSQNAIWHCRVECIRTLPELTPQRSNKLTEHISAIKGCGDFTGLAISPHHSIFSSWQLLYHTTLHLIFALCTGFQSMQESNTSIFLFVLVLSLLLVLFTVWSTQDLHALLATLIFCRQVYTVHSICQHCHTAPLLLHCSNTLENTSKWHQT